MTALTLHIPRLNEYLQSRARWPRFLRPAQVSPISLGDEMLAQQCLLARVPAALTSVAEASAYYEEVYTSGYWLLAEPLHVTVDLVHVYHLHEEPLVFSPEERSTLFNTLSAYLSDYALSLVITEAGRWYVHSATDPGISTFAPRAFLGHSIRSYFPTGLGQKFWQRLMTELQMLLFDHPVNARRRSQGLPTIDMIWFWGEGEPLASLPLLESRQFDRVISDDVALLGMAKKLGYTTCFANEQTLLSQLDFKDERVFCQQLSFLNPEVLFTFLEQALRCARLSALTLYPGGKYCYHLRAQDFVWWKFWKFR